MRFDSLYFLLFFLAVFALSRIRGIGPIVYILASVLFYLVAGWQDVSLIVSMIVINYAASMWVQKRHYVLPLIIILNIATLLFFKYRALFAGTFDAQSIFDTEIIIPLGISFYAFQMIAYQVDLVRGYCDLIRSFPRFFVFIGFFPQLIAGPIVRASQLSSQIDQLFSKQPRKVTIYSLGLALCLLGLIKKVVLSDSIAPFVDEAFSELPHGALEAWQGTLAFGFQIYYDFSGYSDIALGLAYLLGIRLPINFRQPYLATTPQLFWQRWHITLSTWIRDYLYIPLGGSRAEGKAQQFLVLLFVMAVMGMWHGANWTFALWGLGWGIAIALWRYFGDVLKPVPLLSWLLTMLIAFTLWVFFRAPDVDFALQYIQRMFSFNLEFSSISISIWTGFLALAGFHFIEGRFYNLVGIRILKNLNTPFWWGLLGGLCFLILLIPKTLDNPFIYFRF